MMHGDQATTKTTTCRWRRVATPTTPQKKRDWKSVSVGVMMVSGMVLGWLFKKQKNGAQSTMKSDFVAASQTIPEMMVTMRLRKYIGVLIHPSLILRVRNQATIAQIKGEYTSDGMKSRSAIKIGERSEHKKDDQGAVMRI